MSRGNKFYVNIGKRALDIVFSLFLLICLFPVFIVVSILIKFKLGSPVIFSQQRPGLNNKIFRMFKFRSMTNEKDENGNLLSDEVRLTSFGKLLRESSLDELPELWNIFKGDMSFVGPRPQLVKDLIFMSNNDKKRHNTLPGLTGWAQVNGRNNISWEDKFKFDLFYIENQSFTLDMKIVFMTVFKVIKKSDVNTSGMETAEDLGDYLLRTGKIDEEDYKKNMELIK